MNNILPKVLINIADDLSEKKAISGEELIWVIDREVKRLSEANLRNLEELIGEDVRQKIFNTITGAERISVFAPDMHVKLNHLGERFYSPPTHRYKPDELEKAFKRLVNLRFANIAKKIEDILYEMLQKSDYLISDVRSQVPGICKSIQAVKNDNKILLFIFPSIIFLAESLPKLNKIKAKHIIVVPSEKSPAPFVSFIRENMDQVEKNNEMMIWVVNPEQKTISPLVGPPKDKEFWKYLQDPEKNLQAAQIWSKGTVRSRVLDDNS